jgi:hypothetical protein
LQWSREFDEQRAKVLEAIELEKLQREAEERRERERLERDRADAARRKARAGPPGGKAGREPREEILQRTLRSEEQEAARDLLRVAQVLMIDKYHDMRVKKLHRRCAVFGTLTDIYTEILVAMKRAGRNDLLADVNTYYSKLKSVYGA